MIELICSACGKKLQVKDEAAGMKGKCPNCGAILRVPDITLSSPGSASQSSIEPQRNETVPPAPVRPPVYQQPPLESGHVPNAPSINVHMPKRSSSLGIVSLILGILAIIICWVPIIGILSIPLSALGALLAIIGIIIAIKRQGSGIGWPIGGGALSAFALTIALLQVLAIGGAAQAVQKGIEEAERTNQQAITPTNIPGGSIGNNEQTTPESEWAPADSGVRQGDIEVHVTNVFKGEVPVREDIQGRETTSSSELLAIHLELVNRSRSKKIQYKTWAGADFTFERDFATLRDNFDNGYKRIDFGFGTSIVGNTKSDSIYPGKTLTDVIVFELPVDTVEYLDLELPAKNFGGEGMLKLRIPAKMIQER